MFSKINKLIILFLIIFYQTPLFSKSFDQHQMHNYFSALVSLEKNKYQQSLKFFNSSKQLKESHISYIKKYIFSLVQSGKVSKAINEIDSVEGSLIGGASLKIEEFNNIIS